MLTNEMLMSPLGLSNYLAGQIELGSLTYAQVNAKYPQYMADVDAKLIADGYDGKIIDYYAPLIEAGTMSYTDFKTKYAVYPQVIADMNTRLTADGYGNLIV